MSFNAGDVEAKLTLDRSDFTREMREAQKDVERFERTYEAKIKLEGEKEVDKSATALQKKLKGVADTYTARMELKGDGAVRTTASAVQRKLKEVAKTYTATLKINVKDAGVSAKAKKAMAGVGDKTVTLRVRTVTDNKLPLVTKQFNQVSDSADKASGAVDRHGRKLALLGTAITVGASPALGTLTAAFMALPGVAAVFGAAAGTVALGIDGIKLAAGLAKPGLKELEKQMNNTFALGWMNQFKDLGNRVLPSLTEPLRSVAQAVVDLGVGFYNTATSADSMNKINSILSSTKTAINNMSPAVNSFTRSFISVAQVGAQSMIGLGDQVNIFARGWEDMTNRVVSNGQLAGALGNLNQVIGALLGVFTKLVETGIQMMNDVGPSLTKAIQTLGDTIVAIGPGLSAIAIIFLQTLTPTLQALNPVIAYLSGKLMELANWFSGLPEPVKGFIGVLALVIFFGPKVVGAVSGMIGILGKLETVISLLAQGKLGQAFMAMVTPAGKAGKAAGDAMVAGVGGSSGKAAGEAGKVGEATKGGFLAKFGKVIGGVGVLGVAIAIADAVLPDSLNVMKNVDAIIDHINHAFTGEALSPATQAADAQFGRISNTVREKLGLAANYTADGTHRMANDWTTLKGTVETAAEGIRRNVAAGVGATNNNLADLANRMRDIPPQVAVHVSALTQEAQDKLRQMGFTVTQLPDGTFEVYANDQPALDKLQQTKTTIDNTRATISIFGDSTNKGPQSADVKLKTLTDMINNASGTVGLFGDPNRSPLGANPALLDLINKYNASSGTMALQGDPNRPGGANPVLQQQLANIVGSNPAMGIQGDPNRPGGVSPVLQNSVGAVNNANGMMGILGNNSGALGSKDQAVGATNSASGTMSVLGDSNRPGGATPVAKAASDFASGLTPLMSLNANDGPARAVVAGFQSFIAGLKLFVSIVANKIGFAGGTPTLPAFAVGTAELPAYADGNDQIGNVNKKRNVGSGFKTSGATAVVGEGNPAYPEFVIPTDPKYRSNADKLYAALGAKLGQTNQQLAVGGAVGNPVNQVTNELMNSMSPEQLQQTIATVGVLGTSLTALTPTLSANQTQFAAIVDQLSTSTNPALNNLQNKLVQSAQTTDLAANQMFVSTIGANNAMVQSTGYMANNTGVMSNYMASTVGQSSSYQAQSTGSSQGYMNSSTGYMAQSTGNAANSIVSAANRINAAAASVGGGFSGGGRGGVIYEDDPRWNPLTMGNGRGFKNDVWYDRAGHSPEYYGLNRDTGGMLPRGLSMVMNKTSGDEKMGVFNDDQWKVLMNVAKSSREFQEVIGNMKQGNMGGLSDEKIDKLIEAIMNNSGNITAMLPQDATIKQLVQEIMFYKRHKNRGLT